MMDHSHHGGQQVQDRGPNLLGLDGMLGVPSTVMSLRPTWPTRRFSNNSPRRKQCLRLGRRDASERPIVAADDEQRLLLRQHYARVCSLKKRIAGLRSFDGNSDEWITSR